MDTSVTTALISATAAVLAALIYQAANILDAARRWLRGRGRRGTGAAGYRPSGPARRPRRRSSVRTTLVAFGAGALTWVVVTALIPAPGTRIRIAEPADGARVDLEADVSGTASDLPAGDEIWLMVYSEVDDVFYPSPVVADRSNQWFAPGTEVGAADDSGAAFQIVAVLADAQAAATLAEYMGRVDRSGLKQLPSGVEPYHWIQVTRR